jgi:hypothetical protein
MQLEQLLAARADLWRGRATPQAAPAGLPTGFAALDEALCGHGWPRAGLSEVLTAHQGAGLALLLPLLVELGKGTRWLVWVDPPHLPFAPALAARGLDLRRLLIVRGGADAAWAAEQGLRSGTCAAVLAWTSPAAGAADSRMQRPSACWTSSALRRLQLVAADADTPALLLRPPAAAVETSPAALRLAVSARADGLDVTLLKQRGGQSGQRLRLPANPDAARPYAARPDAPGPVAARPRRCAQPQPQPAQGEPGLPTSPAEPAAGRRRPVPAARRVEAVGGVLERRSERPARRRRIQFRR